MQSILGTGLGVGYDALLDLMARREVTARRKRDEERQAKIDRETAQFRQSQEDRANRAEQRHLIAEANAQLNKQAAAVAKQKEEDDFRARQASFINGLDPNDRIAAFESMQAKELGVDPRIFAPPPPPASFTLSPGQKRFEGGKEVASVPDRPRATGAGSKPTLSERQLPKGAKDWLNTLQQWPTFGEATKAFNAGWAQQVKSHPEIDINKARDYLVKLYQSDSPAAKSKGEGLGKALAATVGVRESDKPFMDPTLTGGVPAAPSAAAAEAQPMTAPIPGIPGGVAASTDGGKTWKRVK